MNLQGIIKIIGETKEYGANGFRKREVVVTTGDQYPQTILVEFVQDNCQKLDNFKVGQEVNIGLNLKGREWTNPEGEVKYFNSIQGWNIKNVGSGADEYQASQEKEPF